MKNPTLQEQIDYMTELIEDDDANIKIIKEMPEEVSDIPMEDYLDGMEKHAAMFRAILENLRIFEASERKIIKGKEEAND